MSYDLYVYSENDQPITKENLKAELEKHGWRIAFLASGTDTILSDEGPMEDVIVAGWDDEDEDAAQFDWFVAEGNRKELMQLAAKSAAAVGCVVWLTIPYDFSSDLEEDEAEELAEIEGEEYVEACRRAKSYYSIRTSAGRSPFSLEFQETVWRAIGELAGGLIEDHQEGIWEIIQTTS